LTGGNPAAFAASRGLALDKVFGPWNGTIDRTGNYYNLIPKFNNNDENDSKKKKK
jgi:hypothetical protein